MATCYQTCTAIPESPAPCVCAGGDYGGLLIPRTTTCLPATSDDNLILCPSCTATMDTTVLALCIAGNGLGSCTGSGPASGFWKCTGCNTGCDEPKPPSKLYWILLLTIGLVLLLWIVGVSLSTPGVLAKS